MFLAKSAESIEKKRVAFCVSAKKRKRVRKSIKTKGMNAKCGKSERSRGCKVEDTPTPPAFCMNVKIKDL